MLERDKFIKKVNEIAELGGYKIEVQPEDFTRSATLTKDDEEIVISNATYKLKDKFHITAWTPFPKPHNNGHTRKHISINVSENKDPYQMWKDMKRRLFPDYNKALKEAIEYNNAVDAVETKAQVALDAIKAACPSGHIRSTSRANNQARYTIFDLGGYRNEIEIAYHGNGDHRMALQDLTTEQVIGILKVIGKA